MVTKKDVLSAAKLGKMGLSEKELEIFPSHFDKIFDFIGQLKNVNTKGKNPTSQVTGIENVMRKDEIKIDENIEELLQCSPQKKEKHCIRIPKIF